MQRRSDSLPTTLVDAHAHLRSPAAIACAHSAGISAVRNAGMAGTLPLRNSAHVSNNNTIIISSVRALYKRGGYGARFGAAVGCAAEIKAAILDLKKAGADIIKIMASGIVSFKEDGAITAGGFTRDELQYIVEQAAGLELGVMAHANGEAAILAAAEAGVKSIEHGFFMTERCLDVLAEKGTYWTPTTNALERAAEALMSPDASLKFLPELINRHLTMIQYASQIGVPLAAGTDAVLPDPRYRDVYDNELACFKKAGLSPEQVMKIAGEGGAKLLGISWVQ